MITPIFMNGNVFTRNPSPFLSPQPITICPLLVRWHTIRGLFVPVFKALRINWLFIYREQIQIQNALNPRFYSRFTVGGDRL